METKFIIRFNRESSINSQPEQYCIELAQKSSESTSVNEIMPITLRLLIPILKDKIEDGYEFVGVEKQTPYMILQCTQLSEMIRNKLDLTEK